MSNHSSSRNSEDSMTKEEGQAAENVRSEDKQSFYSFLKVLSSFTGDLSQLTCPGFLLCGTSIIQYCAHYGDHPSLIKEIATAPNSLEKTQAVARWFLSSLYGSFRSRNKDNFEKKPYNPVLGERFFCSLEDTNGDKIEVSCEQVSHHPPISAFHLESPDHGVFINGHCGQKSKFKGTTIKVVQFGHISVSLKGSDETFIVTLPPMHIRSLITGRPYLDLCDESYVYSSSGHVCTISYVQKPWFGGDYFELDGNIKDRSGKVLRTLSGKWTEEFTFTDTETEKAVSFNAELSPMAKRSLAPLDQQDALESQKLWNEVSQAIEKEDYSVATQKKTAIEEAQRKLRKERQESNIIWKPTYFTLVENEIQRQRVEAAVGTPLQNCDSGSWVFNQRLDAP